MPGIVIVSYNSADVLEECIRSCQRYASDARLVVVDNRSSDDSVLRAEAAGATVIANASNRGFASAVNQGVCSLDDEAVLILNPDITLVTPIRPLVEAVADPAVGAAGGALFDDDGKPQQGFQVRSFPSPWTLLFETLGMNWLWPANPVNRGYRHNVDVSSPSAVDQPAGAFLMISRQAWKTVGGFDEDFYPIWFEDVDFCKRLSSAGYKILHVPAAAARHRGGHSAKALDWTSRQKFWYGSLLRYSSKHFRFWARLVVALGVTARCLSSAVARSILTGSGKPLRIGCQVVGLAIRYLLRVRAGAITIPANGLGCDQK